mmetsp:Transcript_14669/g.43424  ORF Transcript_14669/g.43424 Transcript_14669/m.43424 type:complete len:265 (-) Transcript_14669:963-1757(-)
MELSQEPQTRALEPPAPLLLVRAMSRKAHPERARSEALCCRWETASLPARPFRPGREAMEPRGVTRRLPSRQVVATSPSSWSTCMSEMTSLWSRVLSDKAVIETLAVAVALAETRPAAAPAEEENEGAGEGADGVLATRRGGSVITLAMPDVGGAGAVDGWARRPVETMRCGSGNRDTASCAAPLRWPCTGGGGGGGGEGVAGAAAAAALPPLPTPAAPCPCAGGTSSAAEVGDVSDSATTMDAAADAGALRDGCAEAKSCLGH